MKAAALPRVYMCRMRNRLLFPIAATALLALRAASDLHGQSATSGGPSADELNRAAALFNQRDWAGALAAYSDLAKTHPAHALSRFRVGVALVELGRYQEGESNLRQGEQLGMPAGQAAYRLSQALAEQQHADDAIRELRRAASAGLFVPPSALNSDAHLQSLHQNAGWALVVDAFDAVVRPCAHDPRYREFDFWLGDWDVRPTGQPPAGPPSRNTVTSDEDGCVLTEHWESPSGSKGRSFNIFDRSYGVWRQTWVDNIGGQHDYRGSLKNGNMVFVGDTPAPNGQLGRIPTRLTFFRIARDTVRQFSEISNDNGRTWQVSYDLTYVRRPESARP
jgi:tetratricopeptide (TPR) repeat protein